MLVARGPDRQQSVTVRGSRATHQRPQCSVRTPVSVSRVPSNSSHSCLYACITVISDALLLQIDLGGGASISCLASLLQLRGTAPTAPRHAAGGGDLLLFNGAMTVQIYNCQLRSANVITRQKAQ